MHIHMRMHICMYANCKIGTSVQVKDTVINYLFNLLYKQVQGTCIES
jgi:hypothetical protein